MKRATTLPGYFTVTATADDGVRVWVDNNLLIDEWHDQSPTPHTAMVYLNAGAHDWRVEYYNHGGIATVGRADHSRRGSPDAHGSIRRLATSRLTPRVPVYQERRGRRVADCAERLRRHRVRR